jgi:hypothetical protein
VEELPFAQPPSVVLLLSRSFGDCSVALRRPSGLQVAAASRRVFLVDCRGQGTRERSRTPSRKHQHPAKCDVGSSRARGEETTVELDDARTGGRRHHRSRRKHRAHTRSGFAWRTPARLVETRRRRGSVHGPAGAA